MRSHGFGQRGMTTLVAICLLTMLSLAMVGVSSQFIAHARRTRTEMADAQLRQLLLAGAQEARAKVSNQAAQEPWNSELKLPPALAQQGASVTLSVTPRGDGWVVDIHATLEASSMREQLLFDVQGKLLTVSAVERTK